MKAAARIGGVAVTWALTAAAGGAPAHADVAAIQAHAGVTPSVVRVGERVSYRGRVIYPAGAATLRWLPPEDGGDLTWGALSARRGRGDGSDTLEARVTLQAFRTGEVAVGGLRFQIRDAGGTRVARLPGVRLDVVSVLSAADSNASLRPLRGPLGAPWWERIPWRVVAVAVVLAAGVALVRARRRPIAAPQPEPVFDPVSVALSELQALRGRNLPAHGRYAEHAFFLSGIARHFLEATAPSLRPGHTTPEFLEQFGPAARDPEDARRLETLLRTWDRLKFARAPSSVEEAVSAERAVEERIRRWAFEPARRVA